MWDGKRKREKLFRLNLDNYEWKEVETKGEAPFPCAWPICLVQGDMMYFSGGRVSQDECSNQFHSLDLLKNVWKKLASIPFGISGHCGAIYGTKMVLFSGWMSGHFTNKLFVYHLAYDLWETLNPTGFIPGARRGSAFFTIGNSLLVFGGSGKVRTNELLAIKVSHGDWTVSGHKNFPMFMKQVILTMLLAHRRKTPFNFLSTLPKFILLEIISFSFSLK